MHVRREATHVEVLAPAKINLFLEVLARRPDGYHELETLIAAVGLFDSLVFTPLAGPEIQLEARWGIGLVARQSEEKPSDSTARELLYGEIPHGPENLVWRAAELLRERAGIRTGAVIQLIKRVPAAAGLGGASSDAAATLLAGNIAWRLDWPIPRLKHLAAELGSDVPFFLGGASAVCRGRGEQLEDARVPRLHLVIVRPPIGLATPRVYAACRPVERSVGTGPLLKAFERGDPAAVRHVRNTLTAAAAVVEPAMMREVGQQMSQQPFIAHQMSGSGSSHFGICRSAREARRIAARLRARSAGAVFVTTTEHGRLADYQGL
jgi:4-diphosphocytidyl-2-C-methyl-D-erythritol kinase